MALTWTPSTSMRGMAPSVSESGMRGSSRCLGWRAGQAVSGCGLAAGQDLVVDPGVGLLETGAQRDRRFPTELLENHRVVAVPAPDPLGCGEVVAAGHRDAGDVGDDV